MNDLIAVVAEICSICDRLGVPYAVLGGIAVRAYGIPRATYDLDIAISLERERLPELFAAVRDEGYTVPEIYDGGWVDAVAGMAMVKFRFYLQDRGIDVDVFLAEKPFLKSAMMRRQLVETEGLKLVLVSPEDLILLKLVAKRLRDYSDINDVLLMQGQLDEDYMRAWADKLGVRSELDRVLTEQREM